MAEYDAPEEQGAEEEGFFDIIRPFTQALKKRMGDAGLPAAAGTAADVLIPDSPIDVALPMMKAAKGLKKMKTLSKMSKEVPQVERVLDYSKINKEIVDKARSKPFTVLERGAAAGAYMSGPPKLRPARPGEER